MLLFDQAPEEENTFMAPMLKLEIAEKHCLNHCESFILKWYFWTQNVVLSSPKISC